MHFNSSIVFTFVFGTYIQTAMFMCLFHHNLISLQCKKNPYLNHREKKTKQSVSIVSSISWKIIHKYQTEPYFWETITNHAISWDMSERGDIEHWTLNAWTTVVNIWKIIFDRKIFWRNTFFWLNRKFMLFLVTI